MPGDIETEPEATPRRSSTGPSISAGLVVLWSSETPQHVGAWLALESTRAPRPHVLGRGGARPDDPGTRLRPARQRPAESVLLAPFEQKALSRTQLVLTEISPGTLEVRNVGRCRLAVNGVARTECLVSVGDVLELGSQLVLLVCQRPTRLPGPLPEQVPAFGEVDAQGLVGESPALWSLRADIARIAPRPGHALVVGDSGTGKALVANALHALSGRSGAIVARNAATLPESQVDAELFGDLRDHPSSGSPDREGLIAAADDGTLFLDEIAELPPSAQASLLHVLDAGEYLRLGETTPRRSRFRLIAATNRDESSLRPDLAARFDFRLRLSRLSERREDLPLLVRHLFARMTEDDRELCARFSTEQGWPRLDPGFVRNVVRHPFDANVRELESLLWRSLHSSEGDSLQWPDATQRSAVEPADQPPQAERVRQVLAENGGSLEKSWRALGLSSRYSLLRLLRRHGITVTATVGQE